VTRKCQRWFRVREVLPELLEWWRAGETVGVDTVVASHPHLSSIPARRRSCFSSRSARKGWRGGEAERARPDQK
jgi:hypothetical protein